MDRPRLREQTPAEYFKELVDSALERQHVPAGEYTSYYLVNLLCQFVRPDGRGRAEDLAQPLAFRLKRALESVLPADVVWRKKAGFGAPIRSWLRGALRPMIGDLLSEEAVKRRGIFRPKEVRRVVDANLSGREDYNLQVFQLLGLELWHQTFIDK